MKNNCYFCGTELIEGVCPNVHTFKKMCLNCQYCDENNCCNNTTNMEIIKNKIKEAAGDSYIVTQLDIVPAPLKMPTKKCKNWELKEDIKTNLANLFV